MRSEWVVCLVLVCVSSCRDEAVEPSPPVVETPTPAPTQPAAWGAEPIVQPNPYATLRVWMAYWLLPPPRETGGEPTPRTSTSSFDHTTLPKDTDCRDCHDDSKATGP